MKKQDVQNIRAKDPKDLIKMLSEKKHELVKLAAEGRMSGEKNVKKARNLRGEIAVISSIIREKQLIEQS